MSKRVERATHKLINPLTH